MKYIIDLWMRGLFQAVFACCLSIWTIMNVVEASSVSALLMVYAMIWAMNWRLQRVWGKDSFDLLFYPTVIIICGVSPEQALALLPLFRQLKEDVNHVLGCLLDN